MLKELQYAARALLKRPGFSLVAMLTLALGIGANTAIFSVVNAMLLRPLPLRDPERVVMIWGFLPKLAQTTDKVPNSAANFINLKAKSESFERLAAFRSWSWQSTNGTEPELLQGSRVSADFFEAVGASPVLGRAFTQEDIEVVDLVVAELREASRATLPMIARSRGPPTGSPFRSRRRNVGRS